MFYCLLISFVDILRSGYLPTRNNEEAINLYTTPNDPLFSQQWAISEISAPQAWAKTTGSRTVVIAVLDTGVDYNHPDLSGNIWKNTKEVPGNAVDEDKNGYIDDTRGWNFVDKNNNPMDTNGHGTACAGIVGAIGNNRLGIAGLDWSVRVLPLKVIGSQGYGYESDAIDAILYANQMGADVISISWGGSGFDQALKDAIDASPAASRLRSREQRAEQRQLPRVPGIICRCKYHQCCRQ